MIVIQFSYLYTRVFSGFAGTSLFIFCLVKDRGNVKVINHEYIHFYQQAELLFVGFYFLYMIEFAIRILMNKFNLSKAYRSISFEREAYDNQGRLNYHTERKNYAWVKYFKK